MQTAESLLAEFEAQAPIPQVFGTSAGKQVDMETASKIYVGRTTRLASRAGAGGGVVRGAQQNPAQAPISAKYRNQRAFKKSSTGLRRALPSDENCPVSVRLAWRNLRLVQGNRELMAIPREQFLRIRAEPLVSAPGSIQCLPSPAKRCGTGKLWTKRRRSASFLTRKQSGFGKPQDIPPT